MRVMQRRRWRRYEKEHEEFGAKMIATTSVGEQNPFALMRNMHLIDEALHQCCME
jgi:hypothetical protein